MSSSENGYRLTKKKTTRRGFVMTGGGAKGLYEAGVLQAFHLCNMSFDVITGSSIGAINSVAYAEYLFLKPKPQPDATLDDILATIGEMDRNINALHNAWLTMPQVNFIDDSETGQLGMLKDDLTELDIDLPMLMRLMWWWTTPEKERGPLPLTDLINLLKELFQRVGGSGLVAIIKKARSKNEPLPKVVLDTYLEQLDIGISLVTAESEAKLKQHFIKKHAPLTEELLRDENAPHDDETGAALLPEDRTFKDYLDKNIDVRLTRANYRTGLLEISAYVPKKAFANTVTGFWRFEKLPEEGFPVTSFRLELPGNPVAIEAALASSRYPAVFAPFPLEKIYPSSDNENKFLYELLQKGFADSAVQQELRDQVKDNERLSANLETALSWLGNKNYASFTDRFFPRETDLYIDGGAIDNTPSNSAIDAIREDTFLLDEWRRDVTLDLYAVLLHKLPSQKEEETAELSMYDVVTRTLEINSAAKLTTDADTAEIMSRYGDKAEQLAEMLLVLMEAVDELSSEDGSNLEKEKLYEQIRTVAGKYSEGRRRKGHFKAMFSDDVFDGIKTLCERWLDRGLPLDLNIVKIYPDQMPLHTVAFTERLGYERAKGIEMITMGCYNTLWDLRTYLEGKARSRRDEQDRRALDLARMWTGIDKDRWPKKKTGVDIAAVRMQLRELRGTWKCRRTACVFHRRHCAHGADEEGAFRIDP